MIYGYVLYTITSLIGNIVCVLTERLIHIAELYETFQLVSKQQHIWSLATTVAMETDIVFENFLYLINNNNLNKVFTAVRAATGRNFFNAMLASIVEVTTVIRGSTAEHPVG